MPPLFAVNNFLNLLDKLVDSDLYFVAGLVFSFEQQGNFSILTFNGNGIVLVLSVAIGSSFNYRFTLFKWGCPVASI